MSKRITHLLGAVALALGTTLVQAAPLWQISPAGTGLAGASTVSQLNVGGVGFAQAIPTDPVSGAFTFIEHGAYQILLPGGTNDLTVRYSVRGNGNLANPFALRFTSGSIDLYSDTNFDFGTEASNYGADNGTRVASFTVFDGGLAPSGLASINARIVFGSLLTDYLFDANGRDLADDKNLMLNLGIYNQPTAPEKLLVSEIVCGMAAYAGAGCNGTDFVNSQLAYTVRDGGFASISTVPEPAISGLLLGSLVMLAALRRRRQRG